VKELPPLSLSKREQEEAEEFGGEDKSDYRTHEKSSFDKKDHYERSCANQPNHLKHKEHENTNR